MFWVSGESTTLNEPQHLSAQAANQATKDYVTAALGAHEAITRLPRLQTFGKSNRMTEQQTHAAVNLPPQAGDGDMAPQMLALQQG
jgi:hypothetical protein